MIHRTDPLVPQLRCGLHRHAGFLFRHIYPILKAHTDFRAGGAGSSMPTQVGQSIALSLSFPAR